MTEEKDYALELRAMGLVMEALAPLDRDAQLSVLHWVATRLGLQLQVGGEANEVEFETEGMPRNAGGSVRAGTINTVASKLGADSCRTVLIAAAVHLTLFQGKDAFTRSELVALARSAKVWKTDYTNQTSTMIGRLADAGILVEKSKDSFFLSDAAAAEYRAALG
jgi:hypothetical protein